MLRSETTGALAEALAKAQAEMEPAKKDAANPFFKSKYADLASVMEAIRTPLTNHGLAVVQTTDFDEGGVIVETMLLHSSGEWIGGRLRLRPVKEDPQSIGSAITYGRRYGLQSLVSLPADDDDGNAASGNAPRLPPARQTHQEPRESKTSLSEDNDSRSAPKTQPAGSGESEGGGRPLGPSAKHFDWLKRCGAAKKALGDETYYRILSAQGYEHADQVPFAEFDRVLDLLRAEARAKAA